MLIAERIRGRLVDIEIGEVPGVGWVAEIVAVIERGESLCAFLKMPHEVGTF